MYALAEGANLYVSDDNGDSWKQLNKLQGPVSGLFWNPSYPYLMHAAFSGRRLGISSDAGVYWDHAPGPVTCHLAAIGGAPAYRLYANAYKPDPNGLSATFQHFQIGDVNVQEPTITGSTMQATAPNVYPVFCFGCFLFTGEAKLTKDGQTVTASKTKRQLIFTAPFSGAATLTIGNSSAPVTLVP